MTNMISQANVAGWTGSSNDANAGTGNFGSCCSEMDIWEANSMAAAYTPHPCSSIGQTQCTGSTCTRNTGLCDADGCDFNSYRMGNTSFLGVGKTIDTSKVFTVVTQFITADGTATGALTEIRRSYVQNGVVYGNSVSNVANVPGNSISDSFCAAQKTAFGDTNYFANKGGMKQMGAAMDVGMVLVMSIWDDHSADMLWLDSNYPLTKDPSTPGVARGACDAASGVPATVEKAHPDAYVIYSNIKVGDIGSTFKAGTSTPANPTTTATTPGATSGTGTVAKYGQCGGQGYTGPTTCVASTCTYSNAWYSQCL
jgi:cellulose 1,4-beta-cellobiosidase